jgi:glycosyltransferase involved in cell wall biosynthesis
VKRERERPLQRRELLMNEIVVTGLRAQVSAPEISVVIPALVPDRELRRCVDSIRLACGSSELCEVVVVVPPDRLSATREMLPFEIVIAESRKSIYGAMNDGIAASKGRYLYFVGKDDVVLPTFKIALDAVVGRAPSAVFFDVYWGSKGVYSGRPSRWLVLGRNVCHQGILYSREAVLRHGPYVRKMRVQADHLLNIRLLWDSRLRDSIVYLASPLAWYSGDGFSTMSRDKVFWRLYPLVMRRYVGRSAACALVMYRKLRGR